MAEQYLQNINEAPGMEITILRSPLIYGPGVKGNFLNMLKWTHKGLPLPFAQIKNKRTFFGVLENIVFRQFETFSRERERKNEILNL